MWVCREGLCSLPRRDIGKSVGASDYAGIVRKSMCLGRGGGVDASWRWRGRVVPRGDCRQSILSTGKMVSSLDGGIDGGDCRGGRAYGDVVL